MDGQGELDMEMTIANRVQSAGNSTGSLKEGQRHGKAAAATTKAAAKAKAGGWCQTEASSKK